MANRVAAPRAVGRYLLFDEIAAGGMASVHLGRMTGVAGFARTVAIKRLHPQYAKDPEFVSMFIDEARLAARISHPNVVSTIDVVNDGGEMLLVMEYVFGAPLSHLCQRARAEGRQIPTGIAASIVAGALYGLQSAHEAKSDGGDLLGVVHRDVSPQNILVGVDGVARVVDFGIAKAMGRLQTTREGQLKGKTSYMAPEQIRGVEIDRRADVYAAAVVLWEALAGRRLFAADHPMATMNAVFEKPVPVVSELRPDVPPGLDEVVARGLSREPDERYATAREMAIALETAVHVASTREVGDWVQTSASEMLERRARLAADIESSSGVGVVAPGPAAASTHGVDLDVFTDASHVGSVKPRRRSGWVAVVAVAALLCGGVVAARGLVARSASAPAAPPSSAEAALPSAALPDTPAPPEVVAAPASASASLPHDDSAAAAPAPPRAKPVVRARPSAVRCDPPYTLDSDGIRHWKSGC